MFLIVAFSLNCDVSSLNSPINDGLSILILYIYWKYKIYLANKWSIEAIELFTDYRKQIDHWNCLLKAITFISLDLPIVWSPTSLSLHPTSRLMGIWNVPSWNYFSFSPPPSPSQGGGCHGSLLPGCGERRGLGGEDWGEKGGGGCLSDRVRADLQQETGPAL